MEQVKRVLVEVALSELVDKLTILEIKSERIRDADKLANVLQELHVLGQARREFMPVCPELACPELERLTDELKTINESLWEIEERIRGCEQEKDFGIRFIELARSVYRTNDRRSAIKRKIDEVVGSPFMEEKSFPLPVVDW